QPVITEFDNFISCIKYVSSCLNISTIEMLSSEYDSKDLEKNINFICRSSGIFYRKVSLSEKWWNKDSGILFCRLKSNAKSVVLIPRSFKGYDIFDPEINQLEKISSEQIADIADIAYVIFPAFSEIAIPTRRLVQNSFAVNWRESVAIIIMSALSGLIALALPLVTGFIFDNVIPWALKNELLQLATCLFILTINVAIFNLTESYLVTRINTKISNTIIPMVWGRILQLPVDFFKTYTVGDLMSRINGFLTIQDFLAHSTISLALAFSFAIFSSFLLFYYSIKLAFISLVIIVFSVFVNFIINFIILIYKNKQVELQGNFAGVLQQIVKSITKIRAAHAEKRVFGFFSKTFGKITKIGYTIGTLSNISTVFNSFFSSLAIIILFAIMGKQLTETLSIGQFIAFMVAFYMLFNSLSILGGIVAQAINIIPYYTRFRPVLNASPEKRIGKNNPENLMGKISIENLSFFYQNDKNQKPHQV
ncbi:MAG: ABC transporter transmembrane domain-containing protein, partial [Gammaproteobacteria bacterium]